jgi:hypothetical protein
MTKRPLPSGVGGTGPPHHGANSRGVAVANTEEDKRQRAELAQELGFYPASLAPADVDRHRRLNAALDRALTLDRIHRKFAHLREAKRRAEVEASGRAEVSDLYE